MVDTRYATSIMNLEYNNSVSAKVECIIPMLTKAFGIQWAVQLARLEILKKKKKK